MVVTSKNDSHDCDLAMLRLVGWAMPSGDVVYLMMLNSGSGGRTVTEDVSASVCVPVENVVYGLVSV